MNIDIKSTKNAFNLLDYRKEGILNVEEVLENMTKLGYDVINPELFELVKSLGNKKINYDEFKKSLSELISQKEEDTGLKKMYNILIFNPKAEAIDGELLKRIGNETGNPLTDYEIKYILYKIGNGKAISLESFINFMKK